jgi:ABC-type branched-subunit amino acid transport system substrate-binding protein
LPPVEIPRTRRDRWRRRLRSKRAITAYALTAAVIAAVIVVPAVALVPPSPCHGGLVAVPDGGQTDCVGLTDGSQVFDPRLAGVERLIHTENDSVTASGKPWVAIAYLVPMTLNEGSAITLEGVHEELQGAYVAQWEANHTHAYGDLPMLKLYLVNEGPDQGSWPTAVKQILAATGDGRGVVAVAGLGDSVDATRAAATEMSDAQLAMFGTAITADNLNGTRYSSLVRVAPTNLDEVKAALAFLPSLPSRGSTAMLVADTNAADDYTRTWATGVESLYPVGGRRFVWAPETFNRTLSAEGDRFVQISGVVCERQPQVVFFAGRAKDLETFIGALGARGCGDPVTVISGDDDLIDSGTTTAADYTAYLSALSTGNITLYSTALAHPDEWKPAICGPTPPSQLDAARTFAKFDKDYAYLLGRLALPLSLGNAMLARDAVITAAMTIRGPVKQTTGVAQQPYRYQEVTQNLGGLHDTPIPGASGVITISNYGPSNGDPLGKPLAIVEHTPSGSVTCERVEIP